MARVPRHSPDVIADINITPFTDVVLVLLIIFMIATPLLMLEGIKVVLPVSKKQTDTVVTDNVTITISILAQGDILLDGQKYSLGQLRSALQQSMKADQNTIVAIGAEPDTMYDRVVQVIDAARAAGVSKYVLVR
jgi:biopolymer transport protein ExbD